MNKKYGHPLFYQILDELAELHSRKNYMYSTDKDPLSNFRSAGRMVEKLFKPNINVPLATALVYMSKQYDGVINIVGEGKTDTVESVRDKLMDIAVYSVLSVILNEELSPETKNLYKSLGISDKEFKKYEQKKHEQQKDKDIGEIEEKVINK